MTNPEKVLAFLDITGDWDPSLAFVMGTALIVSAIAHRVPCSPGTAGLSKNLPPSLGAFSFVGIDARLVGGASLFGAGWGLVGFCPGPALAALVTGSSKVLLFTTAMVAGMGAFRFVTRIGSAASTVSDG
jgi:uncharacterized membrane protein YedE/YeeE